MAVRGPETPPEEFRWEREMMRLDAVVVHLTACVMRLEECVVRLRPPDEAGDGDPSNPLTPGQGDAAPQALFPTFEEPPPPSAEEKEASAREAEFQARVEKIEKMTEEERQEEYETRWVTAP